MGWMRRTGAFGMLLMFGFQLSTHFHIFYNCQSPHLCAHRHGFRPWKFFTNLSSDAGESAVQKHVLQSPTLPWNAASVVPDLSLVRDDRGWTVLHQPINSSSENLITNPIVAHLARVLKGCGQICDTSMTGKSSKFFDQILKQVDCRALWSNDAIDEPRPPGVAPDLPKDLEMLFTYGGKVQLTKRPFLINNFPSTAESAKQAYLGASAMTAVWSKDLIDKWAADCGAGRLEGNYGRASTQAVLDGLHETQGVKGGHVLVIGSENPWVEACILFAGARHVTTLEYGRILSEHPRVSSLLPNEAREAYLNGSLPQFDAVVTYSSVEHSGLGRYGDSLNPWGDLQAMARAWCVCKPGGGLLLGIMLATPDRKNSFSSLLSALHRCNCQ